MKTIYFVGDEHGRIKIGYSNASTRRLNSLQCHNADELTLLAVEEGKNISGRERELHKRFVHLRIRGEWFWAGDDLLDYVRTLLDDTSLLDEWIEKNKPQTEQIEVHHIIKKAEDAAKHILIDAEVEAHSIIRRAKDEAQGIIQGAQKEIPNIVKKHIIQKAKDEAQRIIRDAEIKAQYIIWDAQDKAQSNTPSHSEFDCRCCRCVQASTTVKEREGGLPWCDTCWRNSQLTKDKALARIAKQAYRMGLGNPQMAQEYQLLS